MEDLEIDDRVKTVILQFSFSNKNLIPKWMPVDEEESMQARSHRKGRPATGELLIDHVPNVGIANLPDDLDLRAGLRLFDARCFPRTKKYKKYTMVRFSFGRFTDCKSKFFRELLKTRYPEALDDFCRSAMWRVRAYRNPISGSVRSSISINLEAREPLLGPDGKPRQVWEKDEVGRRVGDAPKELRARHHLRVTSPVAA